MDKKNKQLIVNAVLKQLENAKPTEQDKSVMIKLTPDEIVNTAMMGAKYWENARKANTTLTMKEVCQHHCDIQLSILQATDPDRFERSN